MTEDYDPTIDYGRAAYRFSPDGKSILTTTIRKWQWTPPSVRFMAHEALRPLVLAEDPMDIVGTREIANRMNIKHAETIHNWRTRYKDFPRPIASLSIGYIWNWTDIMEWAISAGKFKTEIWTVDRSLDPFAKIRKTSGKLDGVIVEIRPEEQDF